MAALLLAGCGGSAAPDPAASATPSVLVGLQRVQRGEAPEWLAGYGSAAPATGGSMTVSIPQPGQVARLAVTPGSVVRSGQLLAVFATDPSAVSAYDQAVTALTAARRQRATTAQLLTQQLATRDQLTQADKAVADAQTALAALRQQGAGQRTRLLTAPFAGVVTTITAAQGDRTQPGAPLLTLARSGSIVATIGLDPALAVRLRPGQAARVWRLDGGTPLAGRVTRVDGLLNPRTRMVDVDLSVPAGAVLPNEALKGEIVTGVAAGWAVPHAAVVTANGPPRVYQVAGGKARAVPVTVRLPGERVDIVEGALDAARPLIVEGAYQVEDGVAVRTR